MLYDLVLYIIFLIDAVISDILNYIYSNWLYRKIDHNVIFKRSNTQKP